MAENSENVDKKHNIHTFLVAQPSYNYDCMFDFIQGYEYTQRKHIDLTFFHVTV